MDCTFASDNTSGVHPKVMEALNKANVGAAEPYGDDPWTAEAEGCFKALFGGDVDVFLVPLGTGANVLGFNRMIRSWHSVLCSDMAHTHTSESGAVEAVVGCKMTPIPSVHGKISAGALSAYLTDMGSPHHSQPGLVALTQSTEVATVYTPEEIRAIVDVAHANGLYVHMDGARIANATVALCCDVRSFTKDLGVDMMSFGGTKNGMLMAESVVVFNKDFVRDPPQAEPPACLQDAVPCGPVHSVFQGRVVAGKRPARQQYGPSACGSHFRYAARGAGSSRGKQWRVRQHEAGAHSRIAAAVHVP